jgi:hypothetical protein
VEWEDAAMDPEAGAAEAAAFFKSVLPKIDISFDSIIFNRRPCLHPALRGSLGSFD